MRMYIASASTGNGIYHCELNADSGEMRQLEGFDAFTNCLYLALHPSLPLLYAVGEGQAAAFRIASDGGLSLLNRQPTGGDEPCYVSVTEDGRYALVVNYTGPEGAGSITVLPLGDDGSLKPASQHIRPPGDGAHVHPTRQDAPHPHMIVPTPDAAFVLVPDLGMDRVLVYTLDADAGRLEPHATPYIPIQAGSGPRHLAFHPTERIFYVLSELEPVLTIVSYDAAGRFDVVGSVSTMPVDETTPDNMLGADIHVTPSGRFLYASTRGHNSITIFAVSGNGRELDRLTHESTQGDWPRGFALDPTGRLLIAANQQSNDLYSFHIDADTGHLSVTGHRLEIPAPVCVKILSSD
jgi:6-phosphogluconolactonase